jgi:hypothetical protein
MTTSGQLTAEINRHRLQLRHLPATYMVELGVLNCRTAFCETAERLPIGPIQHTVLNRLVVIDAVTPL